MLMAAGLSCNPASLIPPLEVTIPFNLGPGLGEFEVQAGQPISLRGQGMFSLEDATIGSGRIELNPEDITITPTDNTGGKGITNLQGGATVEVIVWIDDADAVETVCTTGEQYGPYVVTLDENLVPVSVEPSEVNITAATLALLNAGEFTLCIQVTSSIDATVRIARLGFTVGP